MRRVRFFPLVLVCLLQLLAAQAGAQKLDPIIHLENLWSLNQSDFQSAARELPFQWTSSARDSARAARPGLTLFDLPVYEIVARFEGEKLKQIDATFYARGDAGNMAKDPFNALVQKSVESVSKFTGAKFSPRGKDASSAVKADGVEWQTPASRYLLEYSFTKEVKSRGIDFRAEYIKLEISMTERKASLLASASTLTRVKAFMGAAHIKRDAATGDTWLFDVPMVDQGQKGYCVVASTERVMRYYGNTVDSNELAQIANTDAERGTNFEAMLGALKKIAARFRVRVKAIEEQNVKGILALVKEYNRAAKRLHAAELPDPGLRIDVGAIYHAMDYAVLKEARTKNPSELSRFQRTAQTLVDQGIPLLWCVQLGMAPEAGIPQNAGGHMRLIIGYNSKTNEILYSDSWGAGHELKRMPAADAWAITTGLSSIEPS